MGGEIQRRPTFYEGAGGTAQGKVQDTKDRRKEEGPTTPRGTAGDAGGEARRMGGGVFCLSDIKEPVANFLPSSIPVSSLSPRSHPSRRVPFSLPVIPSGGHTRSCSIHPHIHVHTMRSRLEFQSSGR